MSVYADKSFCNSLFSSHLDLAFDTFIECVNILLQGRVRCVKCTAYWKGLLRFNCVVDWWYFALNFY